MTRRRGIFVFVKRCRFAKSPLKKGGLNTTGPHLAGSRQGTPAVIDYLVDQMRTLRK